MVTTLVMLLAAGLGSDDVGMKFVAAGAYAKAVTVYWKCPPDISVELNENAQLVKKAPEGLAAPRYGALKIGEQRWAVILDEPEGKPVKVYVDTNADGDLTNDPEASFTAETRNGKTWYQGQAQIDLGGNRGSVRLMHYDPNQPLRCRRDYGYEITVKLDGKDFTSYVCGEPSADCWLWIDRDGNHRKRSPKYEIIAVGQPFNFTGTTYVLTLNGGKFALDKTDTPLPLTPLPPDLSIGQKAPPFMIQAMDGAQIDFPKTYAGKLVMLDFWATWCGPCVAEWPNVQKAYETWHDQGFEVLGISFDDKEMAVKLAAFTKEKGVPWPQIYEGKLWETTLGGLYDVTSIPLVLLIDGDSGEILGTSQELRGPGCSDFVGKALMKKGIAPK